MMDPSESAFVLGQRYAFATLALVVAALSFVNLAGLEKALLAIALAVKALSAAPAPSLQRRRVWAQLGAGLGAAHVVLVATVILMNLDRIPKLLDALRAVSNLR